MVLAKVHFQDFLCKRLFCKMYLYEDRTENPREPSKAPKTERCAKNRNFLRKYAKKSP